ncbi:MAG: glycosyl transferase family 28 [Flaviaesturariibacter sp.]|nr:glycosyl transferase family 28 [Flaviaesturariibacter sp.]
MSIPGTTPAPRVLVAPLDWGLGHATRCVPVIRQLEAAGATVLIAAEGAAAALLAAEFPHVTILPLNGYRIRYARTRLALLGKLVWQIPGILGTIRREQRWLQQVIASHSIDAVISDNRYGLYCARVPSVIITHQLLVRTGLGKRANRLLQRIHYRFLARFSTCWVPDADGPGSLAGMLSHPRKMPPLHTRYIGVLSRLRPAPPSTGGDLLVLLSGPEPQRTLLEDLVLRELAGSGSRAVVVRGLPGTAELRQAPPGITLINHLPAAQLEPLLRGAAMVVARSGYSTVMDLVTLRKKSVLIPTPGQTEQEYLATYLREQGYALCLPQSGFSLRVALEQAASFPYRFPEATNGAALEQAVESLLAQTKTSSQRLAATT